jgi:hypothetical protein
VRKTYGEDRLDTSGGDQVQGWQMPGRTQLSSGYDGRAIHWTQVCQVPRYERGSSSEALSHWERASYFGHEQLGFGYVHWLCGQNPQSIDSNLTIRRDAA